MHTLVLLAAIAMMHTIHALPRHDLAVRQGGDDLGNERHVFHHLDRNQRTANRDRERLKQADAAGSEIWAAKRSPDESQRTGWRRMAEESKVDRRFIQDPDYSEGDPREDSNSASPASNTMPTQQPVAQAEGAKPGEA